MFFFSHDDDTAETSTNPTMLVPAMVNAMFPLVSNTLSQENEDTRLVRPTTYIL